MSRTDITRHRSPSSWSRLAVAGSLILSGGLLTLGLWAATRRWDTAGGLLAAAAALPGIVYAFLTYFLLSASRDQVAVLEAQINEERRTREQERSAADRAHKLAQATLREAARSRLSAQAPTVTVQLVDVRGDWYRRGRGGQRAQVPPPSAEVLTVDWEGLSMSLVLSLQVENHGPGVAIVNVMGLLQDDAFWTDDWSEYERSAKVKALREGEAASIVLHHVNTAEGWWRQAKEGFPPNIRHPENSWMLKYTLLSGPPDHSVIDRHSWQPDIRPVDAYDVLFTVRPLKQWVNAPLLWFPTREYPRLPELVPDDNSEDG